MDPDPRIQYTRFLFLNPDPRSESNNSWILDANPGSFDPSDISDLGSRPRIFFERIGDEDNIHTPLVDTQLAYIFSTIERLLAKQMRF